MEKFKIATGKIWPESDSMFQSLRGSPTRESDWSSLDTIYWLNGSPDENMADISKSRGSSVRRIY